MATELDLLKAEVRDLQANARRMGSLGRRVIALEEKLARVSVHVNREESRRQRADRDLKAELRTAVAHLDQASRVLAQIIRRPR